MRGKAERESIQCHLVKNGSKIQLNPDHKADHKPQPGTAKCGAQLLQPSTALASTSTFRFHWKKKMKSGVGLDGDGMRSRRLLCRVWGSRKIDSDKTPAPPTAWSQPLVPMFFETGSHALQNAGRRWALSSGGQRVDGHEVGPSPLRLLLQIPCFS